MLGISVLMVFPSWCGGSCGLVPSAEDVVLGAYPLDGAGGDPEPLCDLGVGVPTGGSDADGLDALGVGEGDRVPGDGAFDGDWVDTGVGASPKVGRRGGVVDVVPGEGRGPAVAGGATSGVHGRAGSHAQVGVDAVSYTHL